MSATKLALGVFTLVSLALVLVFFPVFWTFSKPIERTQSFESIEWRRLLASIDTLNDPGCIRGGMALDLVTNNRLVGLTKVEVAQLLGSPQESHAKRWLYSLGQCGFGWGLSNLTVDFGTSETVTKVAID